MVNHKRTYIGWGMRSRKEITLLIWISKKLDIYCGNKSAETLVSPLIVPISCMEEKKNPFFKQQMKNFLLPKRLIQGLADLGRRESKK